MIVSLLGLASLSSIGVLVWLVVFEPGDAIRQGSIEKILAVESPVYYSDGITRLGVFFENTHRQYVPYAEIPKEFVDAIVAAEDHEFFSHHGVDLPGLFRAMAANIRAGRVVQGGSTITQQTAKNLFKRRDRSLRAKLKELLYALRLEYHYSKSKILEFYANQFYVSGNGRGLGVASRYYFDKPVAELDLVECAFIAGSVKSPNYYNPFVQREDAATARARLLAKQRTGYVLAQMYRLGRIDRTLYQHAINREIPFRRGRMSFALNTVMDLVKEALDSPEIQVALAERGIDNVATSGIRVVTTVEQDLQEPAPARLRQELSRLDVRLRGFDRETVQTEYAGLPAGRGDGELRSDSFLFGRVVGIDRAAPEVTVAFDLAGGGQGRIDREGLMHLAQPLARYQRQGWAEAGAADLRRVVAQLGEGDRVYVRVRDLDPLSGRCLLDLEKYPLLQGGLLVMKDGAIRAMVGGVENNFYNRAVAAKRPMGSVIKPLVYCAALQLGWNSVDGLDNQRDIFVFQQQPYFPRPDHESPHERVSMSWAGVHSENVATVWLLYHLCDRLSSARFTELVDRLGLGQEQGESYGQYAQRIRDRLGVVVDRDAIREIAFARAVSKIEPDLLFNGRGQELAFLRRLHYGAGFDGYLAQLRKGRAGAGGDRRELNELAVREELLKKNYLRFMASREELRLLRQDLASDGEHALPWPWANRLFHDRATDRFLVGGTPPSGQWQPVSRRELVERLLAKDAGRQQAFWGEVLVEGELSVATLDLLRETMDNEYAALAPLSPYDPEVLHQARDFRVLVSLRYLIGLCRELGIESDLEPVLSFPLGSNVISLLEVARAYEAMTGGHVFRDAGDAIGDAIAIIDRVEDSDGGLIFAPQRRQRSVVAPQTTVALCDIMRNVVRFGTGQYADSRVVLESRDPEKAKELNELQLRWPVLGKTGTANRYTNAAFAGVIPVIDGAGTHASPAGGYVVAAYVGFDDNASMVRTSTRISGSSGALPAWTEMARRIVAARDYADSMDLGDLSFADPPEVPIRYDELGQIEMTVDAAAGGLVVAGEAQEPATVVTFATPAAEGMMPARYFLP
ncbi:MAG: transglycosylase domain-containing protein, partial [Desulfobulbaceae bacterium]|nr:transglycosylase domain-containing protein [Desulfobulbaceae bacterium]